MNDNTYWGYDCPGNDLYQVQTINMYCSEQCAKTSGCTHVVWSKANNYTCSLKKGTFSKNNLVKTDDNHTACVQVFPSESRDIPPERFNISTSFQWTCQFPTCSRKANILRRVNPVNTCREDGRTIAGIRQIFKIGNLEIPGYDPAYMCSDQQPWSINDSLAYGFGSMYFESSTDIDFCCICYRLNFVDDLFKDKTMLVQMISHEPRTSKYHQYIELFVPGSEDRYEECGRQWMLAKRDYKFPSKTLSREQCFNLPEPIQNGCLFKFDWLKNVQKPNITYTKIQCPKELTDKSGCSQGTVN
ncbi:unnamed protein product [Adineta ricciae]|uniref:cellulase n=1 Tax=Adineta ricciae TaxID=249248 RepID=A0A815LSH7_ADIRI|nr:unnamed protein product [Adineta ricciae]CAF1600331.1 unnamed protein product [Adineta ricciae]